MQEYEVERSETKYPYINGSKYMLVFFNVGTSL